MSDNRWLHGPALPWLATFAVLLAGDALRERWLLLPLFVVSFYGGMIVAKLLVFPRLERWRAWLRGRSKATWYAVLVGAVWPLAALAAIASSSWWLGWRWEALPFVGFVGAALLVVGVALSAWTAGLMGWERMMFTSALFPSGGTTDQSLVLTGPFRYVRHPLYIADLLIIAGTALLTRHWLLLALLAVYVVVMRGQALAEEQELVRRFGDVYRRYRERVPRFVPRTKRR